jgi:hypothetical protein
MVFGLSCRKISDTHPPFTRVSYPLAVGNWWQYQINETNEGGGYDTITLKVVSMTNSGPFTKYKCYYLYPGAVTDSGYFLQSDTSLSFTNDLPSTYFSLFPNFHLKFPINTGQYWQGAFKGDSTMVVGAVNSCQVTDGSHYYTVGPCYYTNESYDLPHSFKVERMTLTAKIGLVNQSIDFNSDTAQGGLQIKQSVNLIGYHVQ